MSTTHTTHMVNGGVIVEQKLVTLPTGELNKKLPTFWADGWRVVAMTTGEWDHMTVIVFERPMPEMSA